MYSAGARREQMSKFLFVGLSNGKIAFRSSLQHSLNVGVLIRSIVDDADGTLSDARKRFVC
jgi:hypothetical protein